MSRNEVVVRKAWKRRDVFVSMDGEKSWIVIHPDGAVSYQWRAPLGAERYVTEWCCEHDCEGDHD